MKYILIVLTSFIVFSCSDTKYINTQEYNLEKVQLEIDKRNLTNIVKLDKDKDDAKPLSLEEFLALIEKLDQIAADLKRNEEVEKRSNELKELIESIHLEEDGEYSPENKIKRDSLIKLINGL